MSKRFTALVRYTSADREPIEAPLLVTAAAPLPPARGARTIELQVDGLEPAETVLLQLGAHEEEVQADGRGRAWFRAPGLLRATAGQVRLVVERQDGQSLGTSLEVQPTRLAEHALNTLLDELEALAPGLCADLGGHGTAALSTSPPAEATLLALEQAVGPLEEAVAQTHRNPLRRTWEEVRAVPSQRGVDSARDARWLSTHAHLAIPARARGLEVTVQRRVQHDLDVPENQGVVMLLDRLEGLGSSLLQLLRQEQDRILAQRRQRQAFRTRRGDLFEERDRPRLRRLERRIERVAAILGQVSAARGRLGFPASLRPAPFIRSHRVQTHPGYWRLYRIWQQVADLDLLRGAPVVAPLRNTDELYELWCVLVFARTLARLARRPLHALVGPALEGWFAELPRGRLLSLALQGWELHLCYEPAITWQPGPEADLAKLHPGRPWRPDLVLEVRAAGQLVEVHLFDAKHSLDPDVRGGVPRHLLDQVWLKYPDSIGHPRTHLPVVASCWVLYPGPEPHLYLRSPAMLDDAWPTERVRGGAVALAPGVPDSERMLQELLQRLLQR